jgi:integrase/recombinase XerD
MNAWLSMEERVADYLRTRRALGHELETQGSQLLRFAQFADEQGHHGPMTLALAVTWALAGPRPTPSGPARRLGLLRPFARYCALCEPQTEIPPPRWLGTLHHRPVPHIYSDQEIKQMLTAAQTLSPAGGLRPLTVRCLIGLQAATGLRVGEALHLSDEDVDLKQGQLTVRATKFRKSRLVPLHPSAGVALAEYRAVRQEHVPQAHDTAFFLLDNGRAVRGQCARWAFARISARLGWDQRAPGTRPRLYDLRHTFACCRLLGWYAAGIEVQWALPHLATYLGHGKVSDTYWYLTATPQLLGVAGERFEQRTQTFAEARP